jgi:hypothetical protein
MSRGRLKILDTTLGNAMLKLRERHLLKTNTKRGSNFGEEIYLRLALDKQTGLACSKSYEGGPTMEIVSIRYDLSPELMCRSSFLDPF